MLTNRGIHDERTDYSSKNTRAALRAHDLIHLHSPAPSDCPPACPHSYAFAQYQDDPAAS